MDEKLKSENMQKSSFLNGWGVGWELHGVMLTTHLFRYTSVGGVAQW